MFSVLMFYLPICDFISKQGKGQLDQYSRILFLDLFQKLILKLIMLLFIWQKQTLKNLRINVFIAKFYQPSFFNLYFSFQSVLVWFGTSVKRKFIMN